MELSQENRYVVDSFRQNFPKDKYKRVILYGLGVNTRAILSEADTDNIVGLMDAACEGSEIMGYPVFTVEEAVTHGDCVVIIARNSIVPIIFERIRVLEEQWNFPVYNIQGVRLINQKASKYENNTAYWEKNTESLIQSIQKHQTISFDIFDTLITRKCMLPTDIFLMVEAALKRDGIYARNFATLRRETETEMEGSYPKLNDIYAALQIKMNWSVSDRDAAKELELAFELDNCIPRQFMREIYHRTLAMGKKVILVSDMYLPCGEIVKLLEKCDIRSYDRLYISCEEKADKQSGKLFQRVAEGGFTDVLHIGDNEVSDGKSANACGVESYIIWSPYELLAQSSLRGLLAYADTLDKRCVIGCLQNRLFDNPFSISADRGMVTVRDNYTAGYVFLAPIVRCFLSFLTDTLKKQKPDKILFCARDGYVIWKLYQRITAGIEGEMPEGIYFKTSRRAITVAAIDNEEDILTILQKPYSTTMGTLLSTRFGIAPDSDDSQVGEKAVSTENSRSVENYILKYREQILQNAESERNSYHKYMENIKLLKQEKIAVYDFCSGGTIQHYLEKLVDVEARGVYFATVNIPNQFFKDASCMSTLFGNIGQYDIKYHLAQHYMFMEAVLTDEHGTLIQFDNDGKPVYDEAENGRRNYADIAEIQRGILDYCEDTLHEVWYDNYEELKEFTDQILGQFFHTGVCRVADNVKNSVKAESKYDFLDSFSAWSEE